MIFTRLPQPGLGPHPDRPGPYPPGHQAHLPMRPLWLCRACAQPWPCAQARLLLIVEFDGKAVDLAIYLSSLYYEAAHDLFRLNPDDGPSPRELFERFVAWGRYRRPIVDPRP
ncbi:hypothetical protein QTQ03_13260 [Micromonospora sp. WMMA1363]|uniref:hypothetical protein n=1 Tax=Micromonospora sp. WMMA1363 TaxID=3053985 RepID=UPI00259CF2BE|nr:hypothetical protein [Micromonospora sp. WMMA1363]MDM4720498.1 hypothetical protein [Micromonospora sp. WMMA1363]